MSTSNGTRTVRLPREERRAQLLDAALEVFVAHGYHAAAMEDVAERAGISKPVLYQHFDGKLELYLAIVDAQTEALTGLVRDALASTEDHKERVYATIAAFFAFVDGPGGAYRLLFESDLTNEPAVRERLDATELGVARMIADRIVRDTDLPEQFARLLGHSLAGLSQMTARAWLEHGSEIPRDAAAQAAGHLAWRGIGAFPTRATAAAYHEAGGAGS